MKKAFTLVELIIVIGIIAVLAAVLLSTFSSSSEAALSARCLSNLRNLANAASSYALSNSGKKYPLARSCENQEYGGGGGARLSRYEERPGWISWYSEGLYEEGSGEWYSEQSQKDRCRTVGLYSSDEEEVEYAFKHGTVFQYTGNNASTYLCPLHKDTFANAHWSYLMNHLVDDAVYAAKVSVGSRRVSTDRILLFGEIPFRQKSPGDWFVDNGKNEGTQETDACLDYEDNEHLGFNHKSGKFWVANVVFADAHVEKIRAPLGVSADSIRKVTEWLCEGYDISITESEFRKLDNRE